MWKDKTTQFESGAVRDSQENKNRPDLIPVECLWRLGWLYKKGCDHYGPHNWEKGIPDESFVASLERHIYKYRMGWKDEDHLASAVFNLLGLMYNEIQRGEWTEEEPKPKTAAEEFDPAYLFDKAITWTSEDDMK